MSVLKSITSFIPFATSNNHTSETSQTSQYSQPPQPSFSMIEINGKLYYLSSLHIDECIMNYSHTMTTELLNTITTYSTGLSNKKFTTIVFENVESLLSQPQSIAQEKKVVGFWNPQLSKFVLNV